MEEKKKNMGQTIGGIVFVGFMMIGMGLGFYYNQLLPGIFIGMGAGFVAMGIIWALLHKKQL